MGRARDRRGSSREAAMVLEGGEAGRLDASGSVYVCPHRAFSIKYGRYQGWMWREHDGRAVFLSSDVSSDGVFATPSQTRCVRTGGVYE